MDGGNRKKRLLESNKWAIIAYANLYRDPETKKMFYGTVQPTADRFNITRTTLYALLDEYDENMEERIIFPDFSPLESRRRTLMSMVSNASSTGK